MTEEQLACTLCGAGGHTAAQCNWNQCKTMQRPKSECGCPDCGSSLIDVPAEQTGCGICGGAGFIDCNDAPRRTLNNGQWGRCLTCRPYEQHPEQAEGAQWEREVIRRLIAVIDGIDNDGCFKDLAEYNSAMDAARAALAQPSPAPELERPEVVGFIDRNLLRQDIDTMLWRRKLRECTEPLMTVAQHDRIVGALRTENALLREERDSHQRCAIRAIEERSITNSRLIEVARTRDAAQARVAGASAILEVVARYAPGVGLPATLHRAALDAHDWMQGKAPVAQAGQVHALDKQCRDDVARALDLIPHGDGYAWSVLLADIKTAVKVAQAVQVPENVRDELARRCLWLAFCWNDHNFEAAHICARKEAEKHGITSLDEANAWLAAAPAQGGE